MKKTRARRHKPTLISHHSTTGKRLPKEYTSYPLLIFILLFLGVFMAGLTFTASAADIGVGAVVPADPPTTPATIITPVTGATFSDIPITVNGTCDAGDMVKLYRNNTFSGAVLCALDNTFQLQTALFEGGNDLQAKIFNNTNNEGPTSPIVHVDYVIPVAPPTGGGTTTPATPTPNPSSSGSDSVADPSKPAFMLNAENFYKGYYTGDTVEWQIDALGGTAPYAFSVNWGDGNTSIISRKEAGAFTIKHVYERAGGYQGSYAIRITASDADDNETFLQLMIIVRDKDKENVSVAIPGSTSSGDQLPPLKFPFKLDVFWPAYGMTTLMAASFWLGQRRELLRLRPKLRVHKS